MITRTAIHRAVWSRPATTVAKELGITSTAVAKIARKLAVPVPPPGHWARVHAGQPKPKPPPLPPIAKGAPSRHTITGSRKRDPDPIEPPRALTPVPEPAPPPAPIDIEALVADADVRLVILERATKLRTLADAMEPRIHTLPANAPQRAWLRSVREEIARAEGDVLRGLGEGGEQSAPDSLNGVESFLPGARDADGRGSLQRRIVFTGCGWRSGSSAPTRV